MCNVDNLRAIFEEKRKNRILILGGSGFLGSNLIEELLKKEDTKYVINLDINPTSIPHLTSTPSNHLDVVLQSNDTNYFYQQADLAEESGFVLVEQYLDNIDILIIMASSVGVKNLERHPIDFAINNSKISNNIIRIMQKLEELPFSSMPKVIYYSSSEVYGSCDRVIDKNTIPNPLVPSLCIGDTEEQTYLSYKARNVYSLGKLQNEILLSQFFNDAKSNKLAIVRPFNISGKYQRKGAIFEMVLSAIRDGIIFYTEDSYRTFTPVHVATTQVLELLDSEQLPRLTNLTAPWHMPLTFSMKDIAERIRVCANKYKDILDFNIDITICESIEYPDGNYISSRITQNIPILYTPEVIHYEYIDSIIDEVFKDTLAFIYTKHLTFDEDFLVTLEDEDEDEDENLQFYQYSLLSSSYKSKTGINLEYLKQIRKLVGLYDEEYDSLIEEDK